MSPKFVFNLDGTVVSSLNLPWAGYLQWTRLAVVVALAANTSFHVFGQGTRADYERAPNLRKVTENKVYRDRIQPNWLPGGTQFWYQVKTGADAHEFVFVDADKGTREPAFDHTRLAESLTKAGVKGARVEKLPIEKLELKPSENALSFRAGGKSWRCDSKTYELREEPPTKDEPLSGLPAEDAPRASTRTGSETSLTFINRTDGEVELFWLTAEGERQSYGRLNAGGEREQHTYAGHVWLIADGAGKTLAVFQAEEKPARAEIAGRARTAGRSRPAANESRSQRPARDTSPDGKWRAVIKDDNLMVKNLEDGEEVALSSDGRADDAYGERVYWSPDSKRLVAVRTKKGEEHKVSMVESSPKDQVQPKFHTIDYRKPGDRVPVAKPQLFDVIAQRQIPVGDELFPNPWSVSDVRWDKDSSRFTFLYNQRGHQVLRIVAVDAKTGAARALVDETAKTFIDYSGKQFTEYLDDTGEIIWMSERDGWNHLYLYDAKAGAVKNPITRGAWVVRGVERVDKEKRQVWFRAGGIHPGQDPYHIHFARVNFDGTGLTLLTEGDGTHTIDYSPDRRFFTDTFSRVDLAAVMELRRTADGRRVCELERGDATALLQTGWQAPERFAAKGRDGATGIYGVICRPTNFDPAKKYPVIENIYAGPQGAFVPKNFRALHGMQELAELGFIVVQIDGMGTSHRS